MIANSGANGVALVTIVPGCAVLEPAPADCDGAGSGDMNADGAVDVKVRTAVAVEALEQILAELKM